VSGGNLDAVMAGVIGRALAPRVATMATFRDGQGGILDTGIALHFPAPHSYTGEAVLELQGHGGPAVLRLVLARCIELGARLAAPGEFTQRAFLNGKLDLAQAESVADLIDATTATAARAATRSLTGAFSRDVHALVAGLTDLRMYTEATLDFPEEEVEFLAAGDVRGRLDALRARLTEVLARARTGALLREGLTVVLVGRPNVGKSSLLNCLAHEEAAIVTALPGTTRDLVERVVEVAGIALTVVDTAGLRETEDTVERLGIERTWAAVEQADLALVLVDAREPADELHADDQAILARLPAGLPRVVVHNKTDLAAIAPRALVQTVDGAPRRHVWVSATLGAGRGLLEREILAVVGSAEPADDTYLARARHILALRAAIEHLDVAAEHIRALPPAVELFAEELRAAQRALAAITGEFTADDLLGVIFSRFCIGK
jgi:tRNA modification GTPase